MVHTINCISLVMNFNFYCDDFLFKKHILQYQTSFQLNPLMGRISSFGNVYNLLCFFYANLLLDDFVKQLP